MRGRELLPQRLTGLAMILICALIVWLAIHGSTTEEKDITAAILFAPMGIYLFGCRKRII